MVGVKTRMTVFFVVVLGIAVLCAFVVSREPTEERAKVVKSFDRTVAEGMRLWNPKAGVDSFRFDSCRVEKMRLGGFRLGGFNVLCIDGLVLNLPFPMEEEDSGAKSEELRVKSGERGAVEAIAGLLPQAFLKKAGVPVRSFSGIQIRKLAVIGILGILVGVARLVANPAPALVWEGGELKLDDLLPNFNETKGEEK